MDAGMTLNLRLDRDDGVYRADESITGRLDVRADDDTEFNELRVVPTWRAHGRAGTDTGRIPGKRIEGEALSAGETREYAFEIEPSPGPYSYRGHYINIDWQLQAEADVDWAFDPSEEVDFRLEPGPRDDYLPGETTPSEKLADHGSDDQTVSQLGAGFGLVFMLAGGGVIGLGTGMLGGGAVNPFAVLIGLVFFVVGGWVAYDSVKNYFAEMKLGDVDVELSSRAVAPGETLEWGVTFVPSSDVELNGVTVTLEGYEEVEVQQGTDTRTYTETLHSETQEPEETTNRELPAGERVVFKGAFEVPETRAFSFECTDQEIDWDVHFHLDVADWPDWEHEAGLIVRPAADPSSKEATADPSASAEGDEVEEVATEW